ncbi:unnamed protein product, partial [marine sediment metagenome]
NVPCSTPAGIQVVDTGDCCGKLQVKWNKSPELDVAGYNVFYGATGMERIPLTALADKDNPSIYLSPDDLLITRNEDRAGSPNVYEITVSCYDSSGNESAPSAPVSGDPFPDESDFAAAIDDSTVNPAKAPPAESFTVATAGENELALSWSLPSSLSCASPEGFQGYRLYRSESAFTAGATIPASARIADESILGPAAGAYTDTGLLGCRTYNYAIATVNCDDSLVQSYTWASPGGGDYGTGSGQPTDVTACPPPSLAGTTAGWQRIFVTLR